MTQGECKPSKLCTEFRCEARRWRFLYKFLMSALEGTVAFAKEHSIPVRVEKDLCLNVASIFEISLHVDSRVAEPGFRLSACRLERCIDLFDVPDHFEASTTSAGCSLDGDRHPVLLCECFDLICTCERLVCSWDAGDLCRLCSNA